MKAALVLLAIPLALWATAYTRAQVVKANAWPVMLGVFQRLQTDAEARRLFQANPGLARTYQNEEVFLQRVQVYRSQFAALPGQPPGDRERYECFAEPIGFRASVKGADQAWAILEVGSSFLFWKVPGEGLVRLDFAPAREATEQERRAVRRARLESDWRRYREVCGRLATDEGSLALWNQEPGLRGPFPEPGALLGFAARVRPRLSLLPDSADLPKVRLRRQVQVGVAGEVVRLGYPFPDATLTAVWTEGRLTGLELAPR